jgi:hypothetical protein
LKTSAGEVFGVAGQHIAQGGVALGPGVVVADEGGLAEVFDFDGGGMGRVRG